VPVFPPDQPSYWRSQRWARVDDADAVAALRGYVADPAPHLDAAERIAERIAGAYAEPRIAQRFIGAVFGTR
jgi:hypothetical protein